MTKIYSKNSLLLTLLISIITLSGCSSNMEVSAPMTLGSGTILIEEFSDIQCPACSQISPQVEEIIKKNPKLATLKYYHYPLSYHEFAFMGAEATECANDQKKGWEYLTTLFKNQRSLSDSYFYTLATNMGLDTEKFTTCLDGHVNKAKIQAHQKEGKIKQIPGTPSFYVNGNKVNWGGAEQFESYLKSL